MKKLLIPFLLLITSLAFGQSANRYYTYRTVSGGTTFELADANTKIVQTTSLTGVTFTISEATGFPIGAQLVAKPDTTGMITVVCSGCDFQDATPVISTTKDAYMIFIHKASGKWDYSIGGGGGGSGTVESVTGDGVDNTDPANPVLTFPVASEVPFTPGGTVSATDVQAAIAEVAAEAGGGSVTAVTGTTNRITSSGGTTPAIDIAATYVGQTSITTLGTVTTGSIPAANVVTTPAGNLAATNQAATNAELDAEKQAALVSGTNIKTVNSTSILGSGNLTVTTQTITNGVTTTSPSEDVLFDALALKQGNYSNFYVVSTVAALQTYLAGLAASSDVNIWFPAGVYTVSSPIVIFNMNRVRIYSEGANLVNGTSTNVAMIDIDGVAGVAIRGLNMDLNNVAANTTGIDIDGVMGVTIIQDCSFFNFEDENDIGLKLANSPTFTISDYRVPGPTILNCQFFNVLGSSSFDYNSNTAKGIGLYLNDAVEYYKITGCSFSNINCGIWSYNGANGLVSQCQFTGTLGRWGGVDHGGGIHMEGGAANNGKMQISNNQFNHNWGPIIYSTVADQYRPSIISNNNFISNAITPIIFSTTSFYNKITDNFFNVANLHTTASNDPYAAAPSRYILLTAGSYNTVIGNTFLAGVSDVAVKTSSTSDNNVIASNLFESSITFSALVGVNDLVFGNGNSSAYAMQRQVANTNTSFASSIIKAISTGTMADGFGGLLFFQNRDTDAVDNSAGSLGFVRDGADNSAKFLLSTYSAGTGTVQMNISASGRVNIGNASTTATARLQLPAGTATANTAPLKYTSGTILTTAEAATHEYNGSHYETKASALRYAQGGTVFDNFADASNTGTGETDLYSYTTPASTLAANGEKIKAEYAGTFSDITATGQLKVLFAGTTIGDTGALTISATGGWNIEVLIIRTGASTARSTVKISTPGASTAIYTTETDLTGLTFTNTNILKITGTAGGAGGGTGDITAKIGTGSWWGPAAN